MSVSDDYLVYIQDQLKRLGSLHSKRMFGGAGLYCDGLFFAIVADDELYLKVDDLSRARYRESGMERFSFQTRKGEMSMSYYPLPAEALEDEDRLLDWAREAVAVAGRAAGKKRASPG